MALRVLPRALFPSRLHRSRADAFLRLVATLMAMKTKMIPSQTSRAKG